MRLAFGRVVRASLGVLALVAGARVAEAQQPATCSYDACALRLQHSGLLGPRVVQGASAVKAEGSGWFSHRIPPLEASSDSVRLHYVQYRSHATRAGIFGILGAFAVSVGFSVIDHPSHDNRVLKISLISGGAIVGILAGINRARSQDHLQRSIWLYNRELPR